MFTQLKNIDTAFKHIKTFSIVLILSCVLVSGFAIYKSYDLVKTVQERIYILANGKALEAFSADRKANIPVELRDHIRMFHHYFFTLDPDEKVIQSNITKALYLADESAKMQYDDLKESGYYANLISGNISQEITIDSIRLDMSQYPYFFICFASQRLIRSTSALNRKLVTSGYIRNVSRSDNNSHGFLIQQWKILKNEDEPTKG